MAIDIPKSDLARSTQHDNQPVWPDSVKIQLLWNHRGRPVVRSEVISADMFFGRGQYGAPIEGAQLIATISRMLRQGPPIVKRRHRNAP